MSAPAVLTDRKSKPSATESENHRNKVCVITESENVLPEFGLQKGSDYQGIGNITDVSFWREKYESLDRDHSEYLKDMEDQLVLTRQKEKNLEEYVKLLEQKVKLMSENPSIKSSEVETETVVTTTSSSKDSSAATAAQSTTVNDHEAENAKLKSQLKCFKILTSMSLDPAVEGSSTHFICTVRNRAKKRLVKFDVTTTTADNNNGNSSGTTCEYKPVANAHILPEYLQSAVSFDVSLTPALVGDVLNSLYKEEEE